MAKQTLREIEEDMLALDSLLDELGGDITDEQAEAAIDLWLVQNEKNLKAKLDGYCTVIKGREALAKSRTEEVRRLQGLATTDTNAAKKLKERLLYFFERHPDMGNKMDLPLHKVAVQNNGGATPVVFTKDAGDVFRDDPQMRPYIRVTYSYDTSAVAEALGYGAKLDFAHLGERGKHIRIR